MPTGRVTGRTFVGRRASRDAQLSGQDEDGGADEDHVVAEGRGAHDELLAE